MAAAASNIFFILYSVVELVFCSCLLSLYRVLYNKATKKITGDYYVQVFKQADSEEKKAT